MQLYGYSKSPVCQEEDTVPRHNAAFHTRIKPLLWFVCCPLNPGNKIVQISQ